MKNSTEEYYGWAKNRAMFADGFEDAIIGVGYQFYKELVVYDYRKCVEILMKRDGMSEEDALEYMDFNVTGAWMGDTTPVFITVGRKKFEEDL